eukprot:891514-Pyramimonas_sp.AAC.1
MPSTVLPGKFNDDIECELVVYKQEPHIFHLTDHGIRCGAGIEIPDNTMTRILDAYHQCRMQLGPAK